MQGVSGGAWGMMFLVPGEPRGKGRPRFLKNGHAYTPEKTKFAEGKISAAWKSTKAKMFPNVPLCLTVYAYFAIPASWTKKKRTLAAANGVYPTVKPDCDNVLKLVADALNGLAYADDKQIVKMRIVKMYAEDPCMVIQIEEVSGYGCPLITHDEPEQAPKDQQVDEFGRGGKHDST